MANKVFSVTTGDLFRFDPDEITIATSGALEDGRADLPVLESLVLDIMCRGVIEPIVVGKDDSGRPVVIDGRQRVKAAREAKRRLAAMGSPTVVRVPAVYRAGDDLGAYAAMIAANEHRQEDDAIGRARKVRRFLDLGATEQDAAIAYGVTTATIANWLTLLDAGPVLKSAVADGKLSPTAALPIAKLPREKQAEATVKTLDAAKPGRRATVKQAKDAAEGGEPKPAAKRMRGRVEIEMVMAHYPEEVRRIDGMKLLRWVLGHLELPELRQDV